MRNRIDGNFSIRNAISIFWSGHGVSNEINSVLEALEKGNETASMSTDD